METTKLNDFIKTVVQTYSKLTGGERKQVREILKRQDTYLRHVQRFNQGAANARFLSYDPSYGGGSVQTDNREGGSDVGGEGLNPAGSSSGAQVESGTSGVEGSASVEVKQDGQESVASPAQVQTEGVI